MEEWERCWEVVRFRYGENVAEDVKFSEARSIARGVTKGCVRC
jgi:hypothetical protein